MRKLFLALPVALALGGCASGGTLGTFVKNVETVFTVGTASTANPITKTREAQIEIAVDSAFQLLLAYRHACEAHTADTHCVGNIIQIQAYTKPLKPLIAQLRGFVDNNDQVNAVVIFNQLSTLYGNAKTIAASAGVDIGALP